MSKNYSLINFTIDHIEPLGKGVFKQNDQIYFIPKTLPGEKGTAKVLRSTKGVNFAQIETIYSPSHLRIKPECPHYDKCHGCHYLHTSYQEELALKKQALIRQLKGIEHPQVEVLQNINRYGYRNRIQLHYDLKKNLIGFINSSEKRIVPISNCLVSLEEIQQFLSSWLNNDEWRKHAPKKKLRGHVEIYWIDNKIQVSWNKPYANKAFTQVNSHMNSQMKGLVHQYSHQQRTLDLFGGNGNLSGHLSQRVVVDKYLHQNSDKKFISLDLYDTKALTDFTNQASQPFDQLILDPPRSGFKHLDQWSQQFNFKNIIYISCQSSTAARDIQNLSDKYQMTHLFLLDMFPGTHHYETMMVLKRK